MRIALLLPICLLLISCKPKPQVVAPVVKDAHPETANLEASSLVGYDGKALRKSMDQVIEANKKKNQEIEDAANGQ